MTYLLIDTCSWIDILTGDSKNELLPHLEFWIKNDFISLVTHEVVIEEWNKHKEEKKTQIAQSLRDKYKHAREIIKLEKIRIPGELEPDFSNIEKQLSSIDSMLQKALILKTTNHIKTICIDRTIEPRKAPFHNNKFSTKDAYIIFSALIHFKKTKQDFTFISSNKHEFGSPSNLECEIHPEIIEKYKKIKVRYYSEIGRAINDFKKEMPASLMLPEESNIKEVNNADEIIINKSKSILDQIYDYIINRFSEINFVPVHILTRHYPFKKNPDSFPVYSLFSLTIDNEKLLELFNSIKISDDGSIEYLNEEFFQDTPDYDLKLKLVLKKLTNNLIFYINDRSSSKKYKIHYTEKVTCNCQKCNFSKLKLTTTFEKLNQSPDDLKALMKLAFIEYRLGNYVKSAELFKKSLTIANTKSQNINAFIAQYNLFKLGIFIRNNYWGDFSQDDLWKELRQINLNDSIQNLGNQTNIGLLEWIKDTSFYSDIRDSIQDTVSKIVDHYYSQLKGGWSINSEVWKLINDYAEIDNFLSENYIIFDKYTEFKNLTNIFTEGLFASHAINDSQGSRLEAFDDWLLSRLIFYGSAESIDKNYLRYNLKKLKYVKVSKNEDTFIELVDNFIDNKQLKESFLKNCEPGNRTFWDYYNTLFCNILTLLSIFDLNEEYINGFTLKLVEFLKDETFILSYNIKYIRIYFMRVGEKINSKTLEKLFHISIVNPKYHEERFFETISEITHNKKIQFNISENDFSLIKKIAFEKCELCKTKHSPSIIVPIYSIIKNKNYRLEIENIIINSLQERFDFGFFYLATIFDIISYNDILLNKSIDVVFSEKNNISFKSAFTPSKYHRIPKLNDLINLCFKNNINTSEDRFSKFKTLDDYYDWLLDMKNFDYRKFHPKWIMEYPTKYYYKKIFESTKTKKATENYLKKVTDYEIQNVYFDVFINKPRSFA